MKHPSCTRFWLTAPVFRVHPGFTYKILFFLPLTQNYLKNGCSGCRMGAGKVISMKT